MKPKVCFSVPGQKGGTERLVLRCLSVPGQDVLSRDRKAGQKGGTERRDRKAGQKGGTERRDRKAGQNVPVLLSYIYMYKLYRYHFS